MPDLENESGEEAKFAVPVQVDMTNGPINEREENETLEISAIRGTYFVLH